MFRKWRYEPATLPYRKAGNLLVEKERFSSHQQKGSHVFMRHPDGRATVVPVHSGETIGPGLLSKILKDVELTKEELLS